MDAFNFLRKQARERRDKAIQQARDEYAATLVRIAALEQDLLGRDPSSHRSIAACIDSVIPTDRPFTTADIMASLEALDPRRNWRKRSLDSLIYRLRERGIVRRLRKARNDKLALYVRVGVQVERLAFEDMTLAEVVEEMLRDGAKDATEIVVSMLEAGYETSMGPKQLRDAVGVVLKRNDN